MCGKIYPEHGVEPTSRVKTCMEEYIQSSVEPTFRVKKCMEEYTQSSVELTFRVKTCMEEYAQSSVEPTFRVKTCMEDYTQSSVEPTFRVKTCIEEKNMSGAPSNKSITKSPSKSIIFAIWKKIVYRTWLVHFIKLVPRLFVLVSSYLIPLLIRDFHLFSTATSTSRNLHLFRLIELVYSLN